MTQPKVIGKVDFSEWGFASEPLGALAGKVVADAIDSQFRKSRNAIDFDVCLPGVDRASKRHPMALDVMLPLGRNEEEPVILRVRLDRVILEAIEGSEDFIKYTDESGKQALKLRLLARALMSLAKRANEAAARLESKHS